MTDMHLIRNANNRIIDQFEREEDARAFVERNFPRIHVEPFSNMPPSPDVIIVDPDGGHLAFVSGEWDTTTVWKTNDGRFEEKEV